MYVTYILQIFQLEVDSCVDNADCSDTEGSYTCTCSTGFSGDGLSNCDSELFLYLVYMYIKYSYVNHRLETLYMQI